SSDGGTTWTSASDAFHTSTATTQTVTGLTGGTAYVFRVAAFNANGKGTYSPASTPVTPTAAKPSAVTGVTASAGDSKAVVSWTAPAANGSAIVGYDVQFSSNGGTTWTSGPASFHTNPATSETVTGLTNGTAYVFRVAAINGAGQGDYSAASNSVTPTVGLPDAPTAVSAVPGDTQAIVSWSAPANHGGSAITGYDVQFSSNGGTTWTSGPASFHTNPATSETVTGLTNGTAYLFRVAAINSAGTGPYSAASTAVTPSTGLAGAPTGVSAVAGDAKAIVSWSAPANHGGSAITGYDVQFSSNGGTTWTSASSSFHTSTLTTQTVTGLTNGTAYVFRVAAINGGGTGPYSAASSAVTPSAGSSGVPVLTSGPRVTGTARVGHTVHCAATYSGATTIFYGWFRSGHKIGDASSASYHVKAADYGHQLACATSGGNGAGLTPATTSPSVRVKVGAALQAVTKPRVSGAVKVGHRLKAHVGRWSPAATSYSYQWYRGSHKIRGATHHSYQVHAADIGKRIRVRVTALRHGYKAGVAKATA
ncbi:MAG TPA: fibronectin type III domain-containing protein, partial [Mycobacteriales bacterium]|nr:fibronectin type III domain-containing protein [Mycobacteriales bacterium]